MRKYYIIITTCMVLFPAMDWAQTMSCANGAIEMSAGAEADQYQWELQGQESWQPLEDVPPYAGSAEQTLIIAPVSIDMDGGTYRCLIPSSTSDMPDSVVFQTNLMVFDTLEAATIAFENVPVDPLCHGENEVVILQVTPPSGGDDGVVTVWEQFDGLEWQSLVGESEDQFNLSNLTQTSTFRQRTESPGLCGPVFSNELTVHVYAPLSPPSIQMQSNGSPICFATSPGEFYVSVDAEGASGSYITTWQRLNNGLWEEIPGAVESAYSPGPLESSESFRFQVTDVQCGTLVTSNVLEIEVYSQLSNAIGIVADSDEPLCDENDGILIELFEPPSGGGESFSFTWYQDGETLLGEAQSSIGIDFLESSGTFHLIATSNAGCGEIWSNEISIEVFDPFVLGETSANQTICFNATPEVLINSGGSGGSGTYSVVWEENSQGVWTEVLGETSLQYAPSNLSASSQFRVVATDDSGCGVEVSNVVSITVLPELVPAQVEADADSICFGSGFAISSTGPSGADGNITSSWFVQESSGGFVVNADLDLVGWSVEHATQDYDVYLQSISEYGCGTVVSNIAHVEVLDSIVEPTVELVGFDGQNICFGDLSPTASVIVPASGADGHWTHVWQRSNAGGDWVWAQFNSQDYYPGNLTDSVQIRLQSTSSFGCGVFMSNTLEVPVWQEVQPGLVGPGAGQIICYNTQPSTFIAQPANGGGGVFEFQWFSIENGVSLALPGANGSVYQPPALTDTTSFYIEYTNLNGCGTVSSNIMEVSVLPNLEQAEIVGHEGDPVCFGTSLDLIASNMIDYPWLSHQWYASSDAAGFELLPGMGELELLDFQLFESTSFFLETTSLYGCGTVHSDTLSVAVWNNLEAPDIVFEGGFNGETLCYGDESPVFAAGNLAAGGGGPLQYSWELDSGTTGTFWPTGNNNFLGYSAGELMDSVSVRLRVTDAFGCGSLVSNVLEVNVFAPLEILDQPNAQAICFGASPTSLESTVAGGGDIYSFQWYQSENGVDFFPVPGQTSENVETLPLNETTWFFLELTSDLGCGQISSDTIQVEVWELMIAGELALESNPICAEEEVHVTTTSPVGGSNNFETTWYANDGGAWTLVQSGGYNYQSPELYQNVSYFAEYTDFCGTVMSDTVEVVVNPLPEINPIVGNDQPCYNGVNQSYFIPSADMNMYYEWSVNEVFGVITSGETGPGVLVDWYDETGETELEVLVTNPITSCNNLFSLSIAISDVMAPPVSEVVKKPGINILVSADSTDCAEYRWGLQDIASGEIQFLEGMNEQYAYFEELDTLNYYYFVEVVYDCGDGPSCPTINYYNYSPFVGLEEATDNPFRLYPNPTQGAVHIEGVDIRGVQIFGPLGSLVFGQSSVSISGSMTLDLGFLPSGLYVLQIEGRAARIVKQKLVVQ